MGSVQIKVYPYPLAKSGDAIVIDHIGLAHAMPLLKVARSTHSGTKIVSVSHEYGYATRRDIVTLINEADLLREVCHDADQLNALHEQDFNDCSEAYAGVPAPRHSLTRSQDRQTGT